MPFTLLQRSKQNIRSGVGDLKKRVIPLCKTLGIGFVAYSPIGRVSSQLSEVTRCVWIANDARRHFPRASWRKFDP